MSARKAVRRALLAALCGALAGAARAEIVVIAHPDAHVAQLSAQQVAAIFLGKSGVLRPVEQTEGSVLRGEFYRKVLNRDALQVRATWAKLVFAENGLLPREYASGDEVKQAVARDVNAIGYISGEEADATVKVVLAVP